MSLRKPAETPLVDILKALREFYLPRKVAQMFAYDCIYVLDYAPEPETGLAQIRQAMQKWAVTVTHAIANKVLTELTWDW